MDTIRETLSGAKLVFLCVGLGGGTGSGAARLVGLVAREQGALVVSFATMPFAFEGRRRMAQAEEALAALQSVSDVVVCFDNDRMGDSVSPRAGVQEAFVAADRVISESVRAVAALATQKGIVRMNFDDLSSALRGGGRGASRCVFVERDKAAARILHQNIEMLGVQDRCDVVVGDALGLGALARCPRPVTVAFFDPPYPVVREALGFRRVMEQAAKVVDLLTPDGILVLRTPWPLTLSEAPEAPVESPRRKHPKRESRRKDWRNAESESMDDRRGGVLDGDEPDTEPDPALEGSPAATAARHPADLRLPNADGPETHVYHQMAVHLYMRPRGV